MEYGLGDLRSYLEFRDNKNLKFSIEEVLAIKNQLTRQEKILHQLGIYHLDIKPQNIIVTERGTLNL